VLKVLMAAMLLVPANLTANPHSELLRPVIVIRSYDGLAMAGEFTVPRSHVEDILRRAGIAVSWLECGPDSALAATSRACGAPLRPNEFILRVVSAMDDHGATHRSSLGYSLIDTSTRAGSVAAVYADRIAALAREADVNRLDLLGRAIAHEIGHLLTGTTVHTRDGLMRALWTTSELRRNLPRDWQFSRKQAGTMREMFRSAAASAAGEAVVASH